MTRELPRLFIPGPTEVRPEILRVLSEPVISHRGPLIEAITRQVFKDLKELFRTRNECFVACSSATGLMEAAIRNLSEKKVLSTVCGAFSERQYQTAVKCGRRATRLTVPPGQPIDLDAVERALATGDYDLVTAVHSETSTGVLNPIAKLGELVRRHDDVLLAVDCVSSLGGAPFETDLWGVDLAFAGTQKCLALPPGLTVFTVSGRAMERSATMDGRGHYFDFQLYRKMAAKGQCPATTNIPLLRALGVQLEHILRNEGLEARWDRHLALAQSVRGHLAGRFSLFPDPGFMTPSESVFSSNGRISPSALVEELLKRGKRIGTGYGNLKETTFRIGHLGDLTGEDIRELLLDLDAALDALGVS